MEYLKYKRTKKAPVWTDGEEPELVESPEYNTDSDEDCLFASDVRSKERSLETKELRFKHLTDINSCRKVKFDSVRDVSFHPTSKISMVTLNKGRIDLFEIDGERNNHLHRVKTPFRSRQTAKFKPDGRNIIIASELDKGKFYCYDMHKGNHTGHWLRVGNELKQIADFQLNHEYMLIKEDNSRDVRVLSSNNYETLCSISINEPVQTIRFHNDTEIFIAGQSNRVYIYDLRKSSICKHKFSDQGTIHISSLALTTTSSLVSIGSDSGVVNTYNLTQCLDHQDPTPVKTHTNLTSHVGILEYNHTGELLLMASGSKHGAFRLVHSFSGTVYRNFPSKDHKFGHPAGVDFSPKSGFLALGCTNGQAHLVRIPYYASY